jgi:hypothetical protein
MMFAINLMVAAIHVLIAMMVMHVLLIAVIHHPDVSTQQ